ncbi:carboxypeptidase-like regulatory domain-containing protein [Terrimonas rubra]|uniref:Carboxypeptidase-like regulatory domain-containing protein n=1 Tax=Terrimonas rubra TaxID=1035890 RepID=A0ABW6ABP9_9BACT
MIRIITALLLIIGIVGIINAQNNDRTLTGIVTSSEDAAPLEGVSVFIKGTNASSGTQADGIYYIKVKPSDSVVVFQLDGYEKQEVKISGNAEINIGLKRLPQVFLYDDQKYKNVPTDVIKASFLR